MFKDKIKKYSFFKKTIKKKDWSQSEIIYQTRDPGYETI
jgi:hypothetical protein